MTLETFENRYSQLKDEKTATLDKFGKQLVKEQVDVSFLRNKFIESGKYFYTYQQVSILEKEGLDEKFAFIESTFDIMNDWMHTDAIMKFLGDALPFDYAYEKAQSYIQSEYPYARRLGYVLFIPRLTRDRAHVDDLLRLCKNDDHHHVIMGEAWLLSFLAMCDPDKTYAYLKSCDLKYNIVGKAIQKICDSYVVSTEDKTRFKGLRESRKKFDKQIKT